MLKRFGLLLGVCAAACVAFGAVSGDDFALKLEKVAGTDNEALVVGSWTADEVQGWSFGVCHSPAQASILNGAGNSCEGGIYDSCDGATAGCASIACTQQLKTVKNGAAADMLFLNVYEGGFTLGIVIHVMQTITLPATARFEMMTAKYSLKTASATVNLCNTLGAPPTDSVFVVNGNSYSPTTMEGVTLGAETPTCDTLRMELAASGADKVAVSLDSVQDQAPTGFSFGIADNSQAIIVSTIEAGAAVKTLMGGADPDYWGVAVVTGGATLGCVFSMGATVKALPACTADQEIAVVSYINTSGQSATAQVTLSGDLGSPKVPLAIDVDGITFDPQPGAGVSITVGGGQPPFVRGEVNQDGKLNVSDGVAIARYVFNLGSQKAKIDACKDSADVNDDGAITAADALYLLNYLFTGGAAVPAPAGACGVDTTVDTLDCVQYQCP